MTITLFGLFFISCQKDSTPEDMTPKDLITEFDIDLEDTTDYSIYNKWILLGFIEKSEDTIEFKPDSIGEMFIHFHHTDTADYYHTKLYCNDVTGEFTHESPDSIKIIRGGSTLLLCNEDESYWEERCWDALPFIHTYSLRGNSLTLTTTEELALVYRIDK